MVADTKSHVEEEQEATKIANRDACNASTHWANHVLHKIASEKSLERAADRSGRLGREVEDAKRLERPVHVRKAIHDAVVHQIEPRVG